MAPFSWAFAAESGILVQPPARRPEVSLYRLGTEPVFFDRAQSMDPQARKTKCRLNTPLTPNPSCECQGRSRLPTPPRSRRQSARSVQQGGTSPIEDNSPLTPGSPRRLGRADQ